MILTMLVGIALLLAVFLVMCIIEVFVMLFTGGAFSLFFPLVMTVCFALAFVSYALVAGGHDER